MIDKIIPLVFQPAFWGVVPRLPALFVRDFAVDAVLIHADGRRFYMFAC